MPSIQNYEKKTAKKSKHTDVTPTKTHTTHKPRRRPGRDEGVKAAMDHNDKTQPKKQEQTHSDADMSSNTSTESHHNVERKKVNLEFYGSELIKSKVPKAFELAENVAEEWVNDGDFKDIPVGHPLAQQVASLGLQKAKKIEKKLEEKGVFMMAKMGIEFAKSKLKK